MGRKLHNTLYGRCFFTSTSGVNLVVYKRFDYEDCFTKELHLYVSSRIDCIHLRGLFGKAPYILNPLMTAQSPCRSSPCRIHNSGRCFTSHYDMFTPGGCQSTCCLLSVAHMGIVSAGL